MNWPEDYVGRVIHGDCLSIMRGMPDGCVDSIVTDPPYELGFMGKKWDSSGVAYSVDVWAKALRVLKPGGHLLAFGGSRTHHRLFCAVEDAGFEIRDTVCWLFGSGFPKSLDVSKAIDRAAGIWRGRAGAVASENTAMSGGNYERTAKGSGETAAAAAWDGWGTALKPAAEYIVMARKPLGESTVAANVLAHGTGAINVDGCRVGMMTLDEIGRSGKSTAGMFMGGEVDWKRGGREPQGRWPANIITDGSEEVVGGFPEAGTSARSSRSRNHAAGEIFGGWGTGNHPGHGDSGSAARFFYCAKASKEDREWALRDGGIGALRDGFEKKQRDEGRKEGNPGGDNPRNRGVNKVRNHHPTVKPLALMRYLCRLVTPPGGIVLDPFAGSGSTCRAAFTEGFQFIGIEIDAEYCRIANGRLNLLTAGLPI